MPPNRKLTLDDVKQIFHDIRKEKLTQQPEWAIIDTLYSGVSIAEGENPEDVLVSYTNVLFPNFETKIAHMLRAGFGLRFLPRHGTTFKDAEIAQKMWNWISFHNKFRSVVKSAIRNSYKFGTGVLKTYYDANDQMVYIRNISPFNIYMTNAERIEDVYITMEVENISYKEAIRRFPEARDKIKKGAVWAKGLGVPLLPQTQFTEGIQVTDINAKTDIAQLNTGETPQEGEMVTLARIIIKLAPYVYQTNLFVGDARIGSPKDTLTFNPYTLIRPYKRDGVIWGDSKVAKFVNKQKLINKREQQIDASIDVSQPVLVANRNFLDDEDNIVNVQYGRKVVKVQSERASDAVAYLQAQAFDPAVLSIIQNDKQEVQAGAGVVDILRGVAPKRIDSMAAIAKLESTASAWLDEELFEIGLDVRDVGYKALRLATNHIKAPIVEQIMGDTGKLEDIVINTDRNNQLNPSWLFNIVPVVASGQEYEDTMTLQTLSLLAQMGIRLPPEMSVEIFKGPLRERLTKLIAKSQEQAQPEQTQQQRVPTRAEAEAILRQVAQRAGG